MQLEDFFDYKNQLMEDLLTSESVVKLLDDQIDIGASKSLAYTQVFPYEYVPETIEEAKTFICFDVDITRSLDKAFYLPVIYVWVFAHKSKMRLTEGGVSTDKMVSEISKIINGSRSYGMGTLELYSVKRFAPVADYQGKVMVFNTKEWNNPAPNKRPVPANRKTG